MSPSTGIMSISMLKYVNILYTWHLNNIIIYCANSSLTFHLFSLTFYIGHWDNKKKDYKHGQKIIMFILFYSSIKRSYLSN